uniref:Uncharacterized protein n=1 Tax=Malurus cyaneus samueli TaxID=2593467 RepID=A0A8C5TY87_9PASS
HGVVPHPTVPGPGLRGGAGAVSRGILEHAPAGFRHVLRSARVRLALLAVFVAARAAAGPGCWGWAPCTFERAGHRPVRCARHLPSAARPRFWVAEVVARGGHGGAVPAGRGELELEDVVGREHRGRGLRGALPEVLAFARARGFGAVVLSTSMCRCGAAALQGRHTYIQTIRQSLLTFPSTLPSPSPPLPQSHP